MSLWNAYHRPPDDPALRFKEPDLLIQKAEANLRNAEASCEGPARKAVEDVYEGERRVRCSHKTHGIFHEPPTPAFYNS